MNRSRLRRMLCHLILDWDSIQFEAETIDTNLRAYTHEIPIQEPHEDLYAFPLSSWAFYLKLQQLAWIIQMGFELDIYAVNEIGGLYWYLSHLTTALVQHFDRIRSFVVHKLALMQKNGPLTTSQRASFRRCLNTIDAEKAEAEATRSFASGLSGLYAALAHLDMIPGPSKHMPYSHPELRYLLRIRPFLSISLPEVPSYDDYISIVEIPNPVSSPPFPDKSPAAKPKRSAPPPQRQQQRRNERLTQALTVLDRADRAIKSARTEWDVVAKFPADKARCENCEGWWRAGKRDVLRSCIVAGICLARVRKVVAAAMDDHGGEGGKGEGSAGLGEKVRVRVRGDVESSRKDGGGEAGQQQGRDRRKTESSSSGKGSSGYHPWWIVPEIDILNNVG